jgi:predicted alpha/beta-fold hydrolase
MPNSPPLDFRPLPLLGNAHLQTVLASFLPGDPLVAAARLRQVCLADNDRLVLHDSMPRGWRDGEAIVLLVHGLTGSHRSGYMQRLAADFLRHGVRAIRLDLRGAGKGAALARKSYHAGCSHDVRAVLEAIHESSPASPITLIGFSLGGNIALKLAGEAAEQPVAGLRAVVAVAPPIDLVRCQRLLARPQNRFYELHFVRQLVRSVRGRARHFPDEPRRRFPVVESMTLADFDDRYTAPMWGFADAWDYYQRSSSLPYISRIRVPALVLTARDDPFIAVEPFEELAQLANVETRIVPRGGHLGFIGWDGAGGIRWAERLVVDWVMQVDRSR